MVRQFSYNALNRTLTNMRPDQGPRANIPYDMKTVVFLFVSFPFLICSAFYSDQYKMYISDALNVFHFIFWMEKRFEVVEKIYCKICDDFPVIIF